MRSRPQARSMDLRKKRQIIYLFKSSVGVFQIFQNIRELWELWLDDERHGFYTSPMLAADAVESKSTGAAEWDCSELEGPGYIEEWQQTFR